MPSLADLKIQLYADGADFAQMVALNQHPLIKGFTTNPTLLRKSGISGDVTQFVKQVIAAIPDKPISFEVLADDFKEMERQARKLAECGPNVCVKIPVTTTLGESTAPVIRKLSAGGITVNATAIMTARQALDVAEAFTWGAPGIMSIFAGRIADTGINAGHHTASLVRIVRSVASKSVKVLWASTREVWNILEADHAKCDLITLSMDQIAKLDLIGKDLTEYSRETVQQFYQDGQKAGLLL